jgi:chloride channel protein, CIC family
MPSFFQSLFRGRSPWPDLHVPAGVRAWVRRWEWGLVALGAIAAVLAGLIVPAMALLVQAMHVLFYRLPSGQRLSAMEALDPWYALGVPTLGGLAFGCAMMALARWRPGREVDPIEANALHGGRMSLRGSVIVALQTMWSSGVGASVGLEAGYTQIASGVASWLGRLFHLRRRDLRVLVGCGAAAAIAAAFGAPLAGSFYAFELIIGSYSVASLAPVGIAALLGYLVASWFNPAELGIGTLYVSHIVPRDIAIAAGIGLVAALAGIVLMRSVAVCEATLERMRVPLIVRLALGGFAVGALAIMSPQVLSSGHGAIRVTAIPNLGTEWLLLLFVLKGLASVISLGTGFRGGLFFSSLLLGALGGSVIANVLNTLAPSLALAPNVYAIIGMGALSVSVIGCPLTMAFIALETTGDFWLTTAVMIAVIVAALVTRTMFGYSFATWRFHLRGESIRSAADVGWIRDLTVRRMMRPDVRTVSAHTTVARFRMVFPLGSTTYVAAVDEDRNYAGMVVVAEAHAPERDDTRPVRDMLHHCDAVLMPTMTIKEAVETFDRTEAEALAVVASPDSRQVVGLLSEAYALRRYAEELELRRKELVGE